MTLAPEIRGRVPIRSAFPEFVASFRQRVLSGLLTGRPHPRSNYVVTQASAQQLHVRAADWWTAINVGLNEIDLLQEQAGIVRYRVSYRRWALFALLLSGTLGLTGLLLLLTVDVRSYISRSPAGGVPGSSVDQDVLVAWAMVVFWAFLWPWLLILLHKRPLHRLMSRLITEVDTRAAGAASG